MITRSPLCSPVSLLVTPGLSPGPNPCWTPQQRRGPVSCAECRPRGGGKLGTAWKSRGHGVGGLLSRPADRRCALQRCLVVLALGTRGDLNFVSRRRKSALEMRLPCRRRADAITRPLPIPGAAEPAPTPCSPKPSLRHQMSHQANSKELSGCAVLCRPEDICPLWLGRQMKSLKNARNVLSAGYEHFSRGRFPSKVEGLFHDTHSQPPPPVLSLLLCLLGKSRSY